MAKGISTPEDFGAVVNSYLVAENDCSNAIQSAIDSGNMAIIPAGMYYISSTINIDHPVNITMAGGFQSEMDGQTIIYTDKNINIFNITSSDVYIRGGLIDFSICDFHNKAAFRYDMNYSIIRGCITSKIKGGDYFNLRDNTNQTIGVLFDSEELTSKGACYGINLDIVADYCKIGVYANNESGIGDYGLTQIRLNLNTNGCKQALVLDRICSTFYINGWQQCANVYSDNEDNLAFIYLKCVNSFIDTFCYDPVNSILIYDAGGGNMYFGASLIHLEKNQIEFDKNTRPASSCIVENPIHSFLIMNDKFYGSVAGISLLDNELAYASRFVNVTINAYNGTDYDFDSNLDKSSSLDPGSITITNPTTLLDQRGGTTYFSWNNNSDLDNDFIEIVIPWDRGINFFYMHVAEGFNTCKRIQTIIKNSSESVVSNIYPDVPITPRKKTYEPFERSVLPNNFNQAIIIRLIGGYIDSTFSVFDIFSRSTLRTITPLIDKGGGQRIYGTLGVDDGVILKAQNGNRYSVTIDNNGNIVTNQV